MKKLLSLLLFVFITTTTYAQNQPWTWAEKAGSLTFSIGAPSVYTLIDSYDLAHEHRGMSYMGSYSICYDYNILRWLAVGVRGSYEGWTFNGKLNSDENIYQNCHRASVLMTIRFTYINRENVQLYSGVGIGPSYLFRKEDGENYNYLAFAGYVTPIGIHVGAKNVYALAELGLGTEALMSVGVGFKL